MSDPASPAEISELVALLEQRISVIGDSELRENDPDAQLEQLKNVSEAIGELHVQLKGRIPFRLEHFLERCNLDKALDWARDMLAEKES